MSECESVTHSDHHHEHVSTIFPQSSCNEGVLLAGGALALTGTYFLVTFAPHSSPHVTANMVERSLVSWTFLIYFVSLNLD